MELNYKRIRVALKTPNPLFRQWLKELIDEAVRKKKKISKTYQKALNNLEKYPLTLYSGHDCAVLDGFGPKICELLEEKLQQHLSKSNDPDLKKLCFKDKIIMLQKKEYNELLEFVKDIEASHLTDDSLADKTAKSLKNKTNLSMIEEEQDVEMKYDSLDDEDIPMEIQDEEKSIEIEERPNILENEVEADEDSFDRLIKKYCPNADKPKNEPKAVAKTQLKLPKPFIQSPLPSAENRRLKKFKSFSAVGNVAGPSFASSPISKFLNVENNVRSVDSDDDEFDRIVNNNNQLKEIDVLPSPILPKKKVAVQDKNKIARIQTTSPIKLPPQIIPEEKEKQDLFEYITVDDINPLDYEVMLLIDVGESKTVSSEIKSKLLEHGVKSDIRKLHVGDFLWIAKHKTQNAKEYVLPYIIERKRLDDLSSSIKDGRFHEQKFRLRQCGIENVIYLIENYTKGGKVQCGLPFSTLLQAAANTQIHNKFQVKFTENCDHTGLYLAVMSSFIENIFKNKKPVKYKLLEFEAFNQSSVKQRKLTVRETFIKQLLTLKGLSVDIALEITKYYPTPSHLFNTFIKLPKSEGETLLSKIMIGDLKRKIPSTISKSIYNYYMYK